MVGAAQQVQAGFFIVFARSPQRCQTQIKLMREACAVKSFMQQLITGQLVYQTGVLEQITSRPFGGPKQAQQAKVHGGPLKQQGNIAFPPEKRFNPVNDSQSRLFRDHAFTQP